jgi:iron-sulfur cluster repair protein YtfE (RIC family)
MSTLIRENWAKHKNYKRTAYRLIYFHNGFRTAMKKILEYLDESQIKYAHQEFIELNEHLETHHSIEEQYMFPFIEKKLKEKEDVKKLYDDHEDMNNLLSENIILFNSSKNSNYSINKKELLNKFSELQDHMLKHLFLEENICVPIILENNFFI